MRLLLLNPNTSTSVTELILASAQRVAAPGTELVPVTAPRGVPYIATRAEAVLGGAVVLEVLAELHSQVDAAVIAAFGDPGLAGARELFPIPMIGLAEAGMLTACMLGHRFAIVTFSQVLKPWYEEMVAWHGLAGRCAGVRALDAEVRAIAEVQADRSEQLLALAESAVERDGADVIILGGAPLAGLARRIEHRLPVPVVDPVAAAVKQAEALVAQGFRKPRAGSYRRPGAKTSTGLPAPLAAWLAHE